VKTGIASARAGSALVIEKKKGGSSIVKTKCKWKGIGWHLL
jgi:hypothetical protein